MSIEYKISWVDDSHDWVESIEDSIKSHLEEKGYLPKIDFYESGDSVDTSKLTEVDLIIIDYQLSGANGDELIKKIRADECLTEIVFYSQDSITPSEHLNGIYYAARDEAEEMIKKIIDQTIKKAQDITLIRGFIIAEAIDVENILEECMVKIFKDMGDLFSERVLGANPPVYDAYKKFRFVKKIASALKNDSKETELFEELRAIDKTMGKLFEEVFEQRNILAHSQKIINDDGSTTLEGINKEAKKKLDFSEEWLSSIRNNISKHKENLMQLKKIL